MFKRFIALVALSSVVALGATNSACSDAAVISSNISRAADYFEINRRIVFYNGINGDYILSIEGRCSIEVDGIDKQLEVTCKLGEKQFKKHFLGISDNVTYFAEQLDASNQSAYHYRVMFKPQTIVPDIELRGSTKENIIPEAIINN